MYIGRFIIYFSHFVAKLNSKLNEVNGLLFPKLNSKLNEVNGLLLACQHLRQQSVNGSGGPGVGILPCPAMDRHPAYTYSISDRLIGYPLPVE